MKLPILISVPHGGVKIPKTVRAALRISQKELLRDGDDGALKIYRPLKKHARAYLQCDVMRAIVDVNRKRTDFKKDGAIKTHTCWNIPIYKKPLSRQKRNRLLKQYYDPYHKKLSHLAKNVVLGIDCHTMSEIGPPIGPSARRKRPFICLSDANGTCPWLYLKTFKKTLAAAFQKNVAVNKPFKGGHIIRSHTHELPWIQLELNRAACLSPSEKFKRTLRAIKDLILELQQSGHILNRFSI